VWGHDGKERNNTASGCGGETPGGEVAWLSLNLSHSQSDFKPELSSMYYI
jgi:hypothetical protein